MSEMEQAYELGIKKRKENLFKKIVNYEYGRYIHEVYDYFDEEEDNIPISILEDIEKKIDSEKKYEITFKITTTYKCPVGAKNAKTAKQIFMDSFTDAENSQREYFMKMLDDPKDFKHTFVSVKKCKEE